MGEYGDSHEEGDAEECLNEMMLALFEIATEEREQGKPIDGNHQEAKDMGGSGQSAPQDDSSKDDCIQGQCSCHSTGIIEKDQVSDEADDGHPPHRIRADVLGEGPEEGTCHQEGEQEDDGGFGRLFAFLPEHGIRMLPYPLLHPHHVSEGVQDVCNQDGGARGHDANVQVDEHQDEQCQGG